MTKSTVRLLIRRWPIFVCTAILAGFLVLTWFATVPGIPWKTGEERQLPEIVRSLRIVEILSWSW
ncbi:hypothetical protein [Chitinophaga cymbidii]|uniref:hypothetical protein n=1 Tax=Chitinophaga cymbidii TaxID=1096750 RepID=UPI0011BF412E|nr:hypothetical protein [Chitinophaga cymbidii]